MKKKRELAESLAEETDNQPANKNVKNFPDEDYYEDVNNDENSDNYNDDDYEDDRDTYIKGEQEERRGTEYVARKTGVVSDININKIIIKKIEKPELPKRITYYLRPDTIKKIDRFSKQAGMGKSEFVQTILDEILNNLEIEK